MSFEGFTLSIFSAVQLWKKEEEQVKGVTGLYKKATQHLRLLGLLSYLSKVTLDGLIHHHPFCIRLSLRSSASLRGSWFDRILLVIRRLSRVRCLASWGNMKENLQNPLHLKSLNHISLVCRSVEESIDFYQNVLGFIPIRRPGSFDFDGAW